jgi:hypothetical protein
VDGPKKSASDMSAGIDRRRAGEGSRLMARQIVTIEKLAEAQEAAQLAADPQVH